MATNEDLNLPSLPPYPEMILEAISALDEKSGSSNLAISKHIEVAYGEQLPPSHESLLTAHLARMTEAGELVFVDNCYLRASPDAPPPPKRGRGRPPKPKLSLSPAGPRRPRGRPPKPRDPSAPLKVARPRGRPPKMPGASAAVAAAGPKRPRGRPPKLELQQRQMEADWICYSNIRWVDWLGSVENDNACHTL